MRTVPSGFRPFSRRLLLPGADLEVARHCAEGLGMAIYDMHIPHIG